MNEMNLLQLPVNLHENGDCRKRIKFGWVIVLDEKKEKRK